MASGRWNGHVEVAADRALRAHGDLAPVAAHVSLDAPAHFHGLGCENEVSADSPFASHRLAGEVAAARKLAPFRHDDVLAGHETRAADLAVHLDVLARSVHVPADFAGNRDCLTGAVDIAAHGPGDLDPLGRRKDVTVHHASHDGGLASEEHGVVDGLAFGDLDRALFLVTQFRRMGWTWRSEAGEQCQCQACGCSCEWTPKRDDAQRTQHDKQRCNKTKRRNQHVLTSCKELH